MVGGVYGGNVWEMLPKWHWDYCRNSDPSNARCEDDVDVCVKSLKSEAKCNLST